MPILLLLLGAPLFFAIFTMLFKTSNAHRLIIRICAAVTIIATVLCIVFHYRNIFTADLSSYPLIKYAILVIEALMAAYIIYISFQHRRFLIVLMSAVQICLVMWFSFAIEDGMQDAFSIYIDKLSLIMIGIIGIVGSLICVYAIDYIKGYHRHHPEYENRSSLFFTVLLVFLSAMFGLVISNDLVIMLFFWEVTTLCSFLLIGYTKSPEAVNHSFLALVLNVFGGLCFTIGIVVLAINYGVIDLSSLLSLSPDKPIVITVVVFLAFAGLTKAALLPFSSWLLGAMVAPTPTSAMLHSSTMVKAGVYMIIRLAPLLGRNSVGIAITMVGGVTFFAAAVLAVAQSDAKKILAYSTISNLGLIVACAGIDTPESLWAAIMLIIFHAISKSLLFLSVGSTEYQTSTRNVELMDGLFHISTALAVLLSIGIAGMFLAPFGMLISKWAAMKAFVDSGNVVLVLLIAFGSSVTLFFWTKWMGKLIGNTHRFTPTPHHMHKNEKFSLYLLASMVVIVCAIHPFISSAFVIPYIDGSMTTDFQSPILPMNTAIIIFMLFMLFLIPMILFPIYSKYRVRTTSVYLSGENAGDDASFRGSMGEIKALELRNWYMRSFLPEHKLLSIGCLVCILIMLAGFFAAMGGVFL